MHSDRETGFWAVEAVKGYLARVGAVPRSLKTAYVSVAAGAYARDIAKIGFELDGSVLCDAAYSPTPEEAEAIKAGVAEVRLPEQTTSKSRLKPGALANVPDAHAYMYETVDGEVIAWQERREVGGKRSFFWWTYYTDGHWRMLEPEAGLPLYGLPQLQNFETVVLHEGAKSARAMQNVTGDHPWFEALQYCAHLGWAGGATNPHRTDWGPLALSGAKRVFIVADNDDVGRGAVPFISRALRCPTYFVRFTDEFPAGFDLADEFPERMFSETKTRVWASGGLVETRQYIGPGFEDLVEPATWLTDVVEVSKNGAPVCVLRESARGQYLYLREMDRYAHIDYPALRFKAEALKRLLRPFSDVNPFPLIEKDKNAAVQGVCYRPDLPGARLVSTATGVRLNTYRPSRVKPLRGDTGPWVEFLRHLLPLDDEREFLMRWVATLVARPGVRMQMAVLLLSTMHGTGKGTFAYVLSRLVGAHNTSEPTAPIVVEGNYNYWLIDKRLVVVHEIYEGHRWKAYQALKTYISEKTLTASLKFEAQYTTENYTNMVLCSNEIQALKIDKNDRRLYVPTVTEEAWDKKEAAAFYAWFNGGGDRIVMDWAMEYQNYLGENCTVPSTLQKRAIADSSIEENILYALDMARALSAWVLPRGVPLNFIVDKLKELYPRDHVSSLSLKTIMQQEGLFPLANQIKHAGRLVRLLVNPALRRKVEDEFKLVYNPRLEGFYDQEGRCQDKDPRLAAMLREFVTTMEDLVEESKREANKTEGNKVVPLRPGTTDPGLF